MVELFKNTAVLEKALDASWLRNQAISNNLANIDTPQYKKEVVEFEEVLSQAVESNKISGYRTHEKHFQIGRQNLKDISIKVKRDMSENPMRIDGNNVDVDAEMALLAKNTIYYTALSMQMSNKLGGIKNVLNQLR